MEQQQQLAVGRVDAKARHERLISVGASSSDDSASGLGRASARICAANVAACGCAMAGVWPSIWILAFDLGR